MSPSSCRRHDRDAHDRLWDGCRKPLGGRIEARSRSAAGRAGRVFLREAKKGAEEYIGLVKKMRAEVDAEEVGDEEEEKPE
jgi:hypothetical protein